MFELLTESTCPRWCRGLQLTLLEIISNLCPAASATRSNHNTLWQLLESSGNTTRITTTTTTLFKKEVHSLLLNSVCSCSNHPTPYHIPSSRTDRHKDSPIYKSLYLFNSLPENIKNTRNRAQFKFQINDLLINSVCPCSSHPISYS